MSHRCWDDEAELRPASEMVVDDLERIVQSGLGRKKDKHKCVLQ